MYRSRFVPFGWLFALFVLTLSVQGYAFSAFGKEPERNKTDKARERRKAPKGDKAFDGYFIGYLPPGNPSASDFQTYQPLTPVSMVSPVNPVGRAAAGQTIWYVNGVANDIGAQGATMQLLANISGQPVIGIHNSTAWYGIKDLGQSINDLENKGNNPATTTLAYALLNEVEADREVHLLGHSQGTIIIGNAIRKVLGSLKAKGYGFCKVLRKLSLIKAEMYGSPMALRLGDIYEFPSGPRYIHVCNYEDVICDPAGRVRRLNQEIEEEEYQNSGRSVKKGKTYGGNAAVDHLNKKLPGFFGDHGIDTIYLPWRRTAGATFNPPPQCSAQLFLFDTSGSMADFGKWDGAMDSALEVLKELEISAESKTFFSPTSIVSFAGECSGSNARKLIDFTTNISQISGQLRSVVPRPAGGTPLYLSFDAAGKMLDEYVKKDPDSVNSSIMVLSDGEDTCSQIRPDGTYGRGTSQNGSSSLTSKIPQGSKVYSIGYDLKPGSKGERDLQYMAFVTGGKYYNAADPRQLKRAFKKLFQVYTPRKIELAESNISKFRATIEKADSALQKKRVSDAVTLYRQLESDFKTNGLKSPALYFNIAQSLEAGERYRGAVEYYQLYLSSDPQARDKAMIEQKIQLLKQDYKDQFEYYLKIIESDITYLKKFYDALFNKGNDVLAREFAGFVTEKGEFYTGLADILEVRAKWLENDSKDLSDSLYNLSDQVDKPTFDRDAVALLTLPISQLEDILDLLKKEKIKLMTI